MVWCRVSTITQEACKQKKKDLHQRQGILHCNYIMDSVTSYGIPSILLEIPTQNEYAFATIALHAELLQALDALKPLQAAPPRQYNEHLKAVTHLHRE